MHLQDRRVRLRWGQPVACPHERVVDPDTQHQDSQPAGPREVTHLYHELKVDDLYKAVKLVFFLQR